MKYFICKISFFLIIIILACVLIPGNKIISFTSSISLDSKIYELKQGNFDTIATIAIGSSTTLNDLNSDAWVTCTTDSSFYNISSWGQTVVDDYLLIKELVPLYHPSCVVIFAHCSDFRDNHFDNIEQIGSFLRNDYLSLKTNFDRRSIYYDTDRLYSLYQKDTLGYSNLLYDNFGGVSLNVHGSLIDKERWNAVSNFVFSSDNKSYLALSNLCSYLKTRNITFVLVEVPTRRHYYKDNLNEAMKHINHCESIISMNSQIYINELDFETYPDSIFADCSHLNREGASLLTENVCKQLNELKALKTRKNSRLISDRKRD